jgi:hypothetical protein
LCDRPLEPRKNHAAEVDGDRRELLLRLRCERLDFVEDPEDLGHEHHRVVVAGGRGEPRHRSVIVPQPLRNERGLAEPRPADHQDHRRVRRRSQLVHQPRASHQTGARPDQERAGHLDPSIVKGFHHPVI